MNSGIVVQLNISAGGVPKRPIDVAVVERLGIQGDKHLYRLHGGPQKALLLMAAEVIDELAAEGFAVYYGALGENLTIRGMDHRQWRSGQCIQVGTALIELTEARLPCKKLDPYGKGIQQRIFDKKTLSRWGESGFYAAVLQPGRIVPGDTIGLAEPRQFEPCLFSNQKAQTRA